MKKLIMCEGPNELAVIEMLLKNDKLVFNSDELLGLKAYHARQIKKSAIVRTELNLYNKQVEILRVGDNLREDLIIPKEYQYQIVGQSRYCTKPELEMLLILSEGLYSEFQKVKSSTKPKTFCKQHVSYSGVRYNGSTQFYYDYFGGEVDQLVDIIREYRRISNHAKGELYLADLLK